VGLSSPNEPFFHIQSPFSFPPLFLMADTEKQVVIDAILLIQAAVAANLYTGIAYGTPPILCFPLVFVFNIGLIVHLSWRLGIFLAVYLISIRMLVCARMLFISD
jgi:hypothetical protein